MRTKSQLINLAIAEGKPPYLSNYSMVKREILHDVYKTLSEEMKDLESRLRASEERVRVARAWLTEYCKQTCQVDAEVCCDCEMQKALALLAGEERE